MRSFAGTLLAIGLCGLVAAAGVRPDETVLLFPTSAHPSDDGAGWVVPVHGWIYEAERDSAWRSATIEKLLGELDFDPADARNETFRRRARMFVVDNERGKRLRVQIGTTVHDVGRSADNGHFHGTLAIDRETARRGARDGWLPLTIASGPEERRRFNGFAQLVSARGVSVISDIDDTIKRSNVLDRQELVTRTFLLPFESIPGMADAYRRWESQGVAFHYVSSSPWQLFPAIDAWMRDEGFPRGSFHLKTFRMKDGSLGKLFASPVETKPPLIRSIMERYPQRQFILVGDSGERDAEVYGLVHSRRPEQVRHIFIRRVPGADNGAARFRAAFENVPADKWTVFEDPAELVGDGEGQLPGSSR